MTLRIFLIFFIVVVPVLCRAGEDANVTLDRAIDQLVKSGYVGDTSAAERYLAAVLEDQPDHVEANWQLVYMRLVHLMDMKLSDRVTGLSEIAPAFDHVAQLAEKSKNKSFHHFITATYASCYHNFDRALAEIDRALALEPQSVRYLTAKARLIVADGKWTKQDARIEQGIGLLRQVREQSLERPTPFLHDANFAFYLAGATSSLSRPRWNEVAEYYRQFVEQSTEQSLAYAFALNNASIAYKELGECEKAKTFADQALKVMKFGAAASNKRYAELCIEMQKMGLIAKKGAAPIMINAVP
jgi:tetratricopeptide (TPR) repeat protein